MMHRARLLIVLVVSTTTLAIAGPAVAAPASGTADRRLQAGMDSLVGRDGGPPGAIAVVQRGSRVSVFRAGVANIRTGARMSPWMHMRIASTAKAYSGGVALSLVDEGVMALDDTVGDLLPWTNPDWHQVTLAQALHHTSGIPDILDSDDFIDAVIASPHVAPRPRDLLSYIQDEDLVFVPGTQYAYSNSDNIVVALTTQKATDRVYGRLLSDLVARRQSLHHTSLPRGVKMPRPYIHGYQTPMGGGGLDDVTKFLAGGWAWASGGVVSTPFDQNRFIRGYVGRKLFGPDTQAAQFDFVDGGSEPTGPGQNTAGLAIFRYRTSCGVVFGHTGNTFGYTQFFAATRSGHRSAVVSINRQITQDSEPPELFRSLRRVFERAVCSSLA
jgi:D-alanyl-D-alanine carboxypeptidase